MHSRRRSAVLLVLTSKRNIENCHAALKTLDVEVLRVHDLREARNRLREGHPIDVVVTDASLPDGNWSDILRCVVNWGGSAGVVVCAPVADEHLWSEVLWRGGHDLLVEPFQPAEARQVIEGAWRTARSADSNAGAIPQMRSVNPFRRIASSHP